MTSSGQFLGKNLYAQWVYSGGTVEIWANQRSFNFNPNQEYVDVTAGSDANRSEIESFASPTVSFSTLADYGGTATLAALKEGTQGTLTIGEAGTTSNYPKIIMPAKSDGVTRSSGYASEATWDFAFRSYGGTITYDVWS